MHKVGPFSYYRIGWVDLWYFRRFIQLGSRWPYWVCVFNLLYFRRKTTGKAHLPISIRSPNCCCHSHEGPQVESLSHFRLITVSSEPAISRQAENLEQGFNQRWTRPMIQESFMSSPFPGTFQSFTYPSMSWSKAVTHLIINFSTAPPSKTGLRVKPLNTSR